MKFTISLLTRNQANRYRFATPLAGLALLLAAAAALAHPPKALAQTATEDLETTIAQVEGDFRIVLDSVDGTTEKLDKALEKIDQADDVLLDLIKQNANDPAKVHKLKEALRTLRTVQTELHDYTSNLKLLSKSAQHVKSAFDVYDQIQDIRERAAGRKGGQLAGNLSVLADVMKAYGGKVPLIGDAIELYGDVTLQLLDATDRLAGTISENHKQGILGGGVGQNIDDPRYLRLKEQFPEAVGLALIPQTPNYLFQNTDTSDQKSYIWDEDHDTWYVVEGVKPSTTVFSQVLIAGQRLTPMQLAYLTENSAAAVKREADAKAVIAIMERMRKGLNFDIEFKAADLFGPDVKNDQKIAKLFLARYTYDSDYRDMVRQYAAMLWAYAQTTRGSDQLTRDLAAWADAAGFDLLTSLSPEQRRALQDRLAALEDEKRKEDAAKTRQTAKPEIQKSPAPSSAPVATQPPPSRQPDPPRQTVKREASPAPVAPTPTPVPGQPNARFVPWENAETSSVCRAYHGLAARHALHSQYRNLKPVGEPKLQGDVCIVSYTGEFRHPSTGQWLKVDSIDIHVDSVNARRALVRLDPITDQPATPASPPAQVTAPPQKQAPPTAAAVDPECEKFKTMRPGVSAEYLRLRAKCKAF